MEQPLFHRSVKPTAHSTSGTGYVRLHGRNYKEWFSPKADVRARYDFLYTVEQLELWVERIRISHETRDTCVVTNNHNLGKATVNAFELKALFGKRIYPPSRSSISGTRSVSHEQRVGLKYAPADIGRAAAARARYWRRRKAAARD